MTDFLIRFHEQVERSPDAVAIVFEGDALTYRTLSSAACRLARQIAAQGITSDSVVAIAGRRSPEVLIALLATLEAGAAYLPLDASYPASRLEFMLRDSQASLLIRQPEVPISLTGTEIPEILLTREVIDGDGDGSPLGLNHDPAHLAYVIYTSGSTGTPKGVAMGRGVLSRLIQWQTTPPNADYAQTTLQFAPLSFDVHFQEIFSTWATGGSLVLVREEQRLEARVLLDLIEREQVERLFLPFIALQSLADIATAQNRVPTTLKDVITAGEQLQVTKALAQFFQVAGARLHNHYGPSETHVVTAHTLQGEPSEWPALPPIGRALEHVQVLIADESARPVAPGEEGELFIGGPALARGYIHRPELTAERFPTIDGERYYKTGDLVVDAGDGVLRFLGRKDGQVKVRGYRIELGEIEVRLQEQPGISEAAVVVDEPRPGEKRIVAYVVGGAALDLSKLRTRLEQLLPEYMVPSIFATLSGLPRTPSGKIDKRSLPAPGTARPDIGVPFASATTPFEQALAKIWSTVLNLDEVGINDNFFSLGGNSLLALKAVAASEQELQLTLPITRFFEYPTIAGQARWLEGDQRRGPARQPRARQETGQSGAVAIIGMAGRFPGAASVAELWQLLCDGKEGVRAFSAEELKTVSQAELADPDHVAVRGVLEHPELFDARFFGISPSEALVMDPQQRMLLEVSWHALENAGYAPADSSDVVGVYAGTHNNSYYLELVRNSPEATGRIGAFAAMTANEKDYVATRIAHRLNLTGPALSIHTACSTSLVAVATAVHHLRAGLCDVALAGGASLTVPQFAGHLYQEGGMLSRDGHTRTFDADSTGTVFSDGVAMVALKLLDRAISDNDTIYAVIHGVAINNDGAEKSSFTAPSIEGQAAVISMAQADAGVTADAIDYVETHGTATSLGDPIEIEALTQAFRQTSSGIGYCGVGSVKSNLGHLTAAAGVAGLIKTTLALHREQLPASLHFQKPNPKIPFHETPFHVVGESRAWPRGPRPRYAGVSAFGVGGTNAHVIVGEAPEPGSSGPSVDAQLLMLSAKTPAALASLASSVAQALSEPNVPPLADVAFTLATGRSQFEFRKAVVADDAASAAKLLRAESGPAQRVTGTPRPVYFTFPGQGAQYVGMGKNLYESDSGFRLIVDECSDILAPILGSDLRTILYPQGDSEAAAELLKRTEFTQAALFVIEYALARRLERWGVKPAGMIGHSVGEFVAACLAGVFDLSSALRLVARRGQLMQSMPTGAMASVRLDAAEVLASLPESLDLAADNAPGLCVVAGSHDDVDAYLAALDARGILARKLQTSHAFHSRSMEGARELFLDEVRAVALAPPNIPIISTLTGAPLTAAEATDPEYWAAHLRRPVRFRKAVEVAQDEPSRILLEVGPRRGLTTLASKRAPGDARPRSLAVPTLTDNSESGAEWTSLLAALGRLWTEGVPIDMAAYFEDEKRRRVALPGYQFAPDSYWLDNPQSATIPPTASPNTVQPMNRQQRLVDELKTIFEQASGLDFGGAAATDDFMSIGVDSLLVTQLALKLKQTYKIPISFRQLMEDCSTFATLASYVDGQLPPDAAQPEPAPAPAATLAPSAPPSPQAAPPLPMAIATPAIALPASAGSSVAVQMLQLQMSQLSLMQQQIQLALGGAPGAVAAAPTALPTNGAAPAVPQTNGAAPTALPTNGAAPTEAKTPAATPSGTTPRPSKTEAYDVKKAFGAIARIHKQSDELTPAQDARLASFVARYNQKTRASKEHTAEFRGVHADPRVVTGFKPRTKELTYPIVTVRSEGCRLWDLDGNEYVDALNGFGSGFFGCQNPRINAALHKQLDAGMEIGPQTPLAGQSAQLVCELTGLDRAAFCNTGSEAVMGALRIVRTVTGRPLVVAFSGSYHGIFDEVIVRDTKTARPIPAAPGIMPEAVHNMLILEYGSPEALQVIRERGDEIAAVLVEPVQSRRPDFQPKEFVQELRRLTKELEIALIFDEVITGFRSHPRGAQAFYEIDADICTYGKVVGGGMPIGVIAGRNPWMDALDGGTWQFGDSSIPTAGVTYFAGTFVRHPLTMAAVHESLLMMKEAGPALQEGVTALAKDLADSLNSYFRSVGAPLEIRRFSSLWKTFFTEAQPYGELVFCHLRERGVHIWDGFPCFLTTAHTKADVDFIIAAFRSSVEELQAGGFLPGGTANSAAKSEEPPQPGARLGRDKDGNPAWFIPDPARPGQYIQHA